MISRCIIGFVLLWAMPWTQAGTLAQFRTVLGDIEVELFDQDKPVTVNNFIRYVNSGSYQDVIIHRWEPGFVIQGGGYFITNRYTTNETFALVRTNDAIPNEYNAGRIFSNVYGTIAMARLSGKTNSATSQWFFNLTNNTFLDGVDGGFTVFGKVQRGTDVLNRFNNTSITNGIYVANLGGALNRLPVLSREPTFNDLLFVDITLLQIQIRQTSNIQGREISWNSVSNQPNRVEFTTNLPPVWQLLVSTNGTGGRLHLIDSSPDAPTRFYRVRADYTW